MNPPERASWSSTARTLRDRIVSGSSTPQLPLGDATVRAIVSEVVAETVAECSGGARGAAVTHASVATTEPCGAVPECLPLTAVLDVTVELAGHLHRATPPDPGGGHRDPVPLQFLGELVASRAGRDLLDVRLAHAEHQVRHLQVALESNRTIGVAVGVLMSTRRCSATEAFDHLRNASQEQNRKLREIAGDVVWTGVIPEASRVVNRRHRVSRSIGG